MKSKKKAVSPAKAEAKAKRTIKAKSKEHPLDVSAKKTIRKFSKVPTQDLTTGLLQASFHAEERKDNPESYRPSFPMVAIGASAGGVESFSELLSNLPEKTGMAFILVQHLSPQHESLLPAILSRVSKMPVFRAETEMPVEPDHVYVIPPNVNMGIVKGVLRLLPRLEAPTRHRPVDFLFRCISEDQGQFAIGVVLSGADGDGAQGLKMIRGNGGLTLVQDPKTAKVDGMPKSAIAAGGTDTILPIPLIAKELVRFSQHSLGAKGVSEDSTAPEMAKIFHLLQKHTGVDFSKYKKGTMVRRIRRRVLLNRTENFSDYLAYILRNRSELDELYADLLINVTGFFRDGGVFETLKEKVFPSLVKREERDGPIRIWVPGCSTGEEVYSIAMSLFEVMEDIPSHATVQIFASDLSEKALDKAREGFYPHSIELDVSAERLRRFFTKTPTGFRVSTAIREICIFAAHDVTNDPPFSRMDLISCRNLLIYLENPQQQRVISLFAYALNPKAYLLLGSSETTSSDSFEVLDKESRIYLRKASISRSHFDVPLSATGIKSVALKPPSKTNDSSFELEREVSRILLARFAPVGVVINSHAQILQFRGKTGDYLEPASGEASLNLYKMAKPGIDSELRGSIKAAEKSKDPVRKDSLLIMVDGVPKSFSLEVIPLQIFDEPHFLILFDDRNLDSRKVAKEKKAVVHKSFGSKQLIALQRELVNNREHLQAIIRDQDVTNEALQAANEEVLSSNEELQSTNEELETAKEELQSANEELNTVNDELSNRNSQLLNANNDLSNLLASVNIPIIMVGNDLRIRRFTPMVERVLNVIPSDIGRPITDIKPNIDVPDLQHMITDTIDSVRTNEREVQDRAGHWYSLRVRPYRTDDNKIAGAVLILLDIGNMRRNAEGDAEIRTQTESVLSSISQSILILDSNFRIVECNRAFYQTFQVKSEEALQKEFFQIQRGAWNTPVLKALFSDVIPKNQQIADFEIEIDTPNAGRKKLRLNARRINRERSSDVLVIIDEVNHLA